MCCTEGSLSGYTEGGSYSSNTDVCLFLFASEVTTSGLQHWFMEGQAVSLVTSKLLLCFQDQSLVASSIKWEWISPAWQVYYKGWKLYTWNSEPNAAAKSLQSCPTLCDLIDGSPPGSPIPGILQARTLEWVAISFSNAWKWKVKVKLLSCVRLFGTPWTAAYQPPPSMGFSRQEYWSGMPLLNTDNWNYRQDT